MMIKYLTLQHIVFSGVIASAIMGFIFRTMVWPWIKSIRRATSRRLEDASGEKIVPPAIVRDMLAHLDGMGFQRLGESRTYLDSGHGLTWFMLNADQTITAEVVEYQERAAASFTSYFGDQMVVETSYLIGERFKKRNHICDWTQDSVDAAYKLHLKNLEAVQAGQSYPLQKAQTMDDVLEQERFYRARFLPQKYRQPMWRGLLVMAFLSLATYETLLLVGLIRAVNRHPGLTFDNLLITSLPALIIGGLAFIGFRVAMRDFLKHAGA